MTSLDRETLHQIAERELPLVWHLCVMRLAGFERSSIEDVSQEVFARWLASKPEFESEEHEKAWFIRTTLNLCTDVFRDAKRRAQIPLDDCEYLTGTDTADDNLAEREIIAMIHSLPESCRDVAYLYFAEGFNTEEIARILKKKPNTVRRELARGREKLQKQLKGDFLYE